MKELPLKALRVFESVARRGSFKDAAGELCVSQSAISHQIKHLEDWLGEPLFDRSGHRPQLMVHAQILSRALQRSFHEIDAACQVASGSQESSSLVIASIPSVAICWLIPRLPDFQIRYPDIPTRLTYALHGQEINFEQVDLAFVFANSPPSRDGYCIDHFQPGTSVPVCSPALYTKLDQTTLTESIIKAGLLHDTNIDGWTEWLGDSELDVMTPVSGPVFEDFNLLRAAALAGQGIALCPLSLIGTDLTAKRLVQISNASIHQNFDYYMIRHESKHPDTCTAAEHFANWVFDVLEKDALQPGITAL